MLKYLVPKRAAAATGAVEAPPPRVTDDPLATIAGTKKLRGGSPEIYAVSRSVLLPRVALKTAVGINPVYLDDNSNDLECTSISNKPNQHKHPPIPPRHPRNRSESPPSAGKSSGYVSQLQSHSESSQSDEPIYSRALDEGGIGKAAAAAAARMRDDAVLVLEHNPGYVKSIMIAVHAKEGVRSTARKWSGPPAAPPPPPSGVLSTIPEGQVDFTIPRPVWPRRDAAGGRPLQAPPSPAYDSDESLLLYSSVSGYATQGRERSASDGAAAPCATDILRDLSRTLDAVVAGRCALAPEEALRELNRRIGAGLQALQRNTDDDIRNLSRSLGSSRKLHAVARALSQSTSSGNSSQLSEDWEQRRLRTLSLETEDLYHVPSASSSSGFSDLSPTLKQPPPVFVHKDLSAVPNGVRNAMIYGTLCRAGRAVGKDARERLIEPPAGAADARLHLSHEEKPSLWEIYYGAGVAEGDVRLKAKPTDTPTFPAGRPEADFTLDVPRAELLMRRMKTDKKWRCRCRIFTSFMGLVFFLLTVMAVSLMLTNGKRMFGSML